MMTFGNKKNAVEAAIAAAIQIEDVRTRGYRITLGGRSGEALLRSTCANAKNIKTASAAAVDRCSALKGIPPIPDTAATNIVIPAAISTAPAQSKPPVPVRAFGSGTMRRILANNTTATQSSSKYAERHPNSVVSQPPSTGPAIIEAPWKEPNIR